MENKIIIQNLSSYYGKKQIIKDMFFEIQTGQVFGIIGRNGAGKTTLIKSILNLVKNNSEIKILGIDHKNISAKNKIFYLPENLTPPSELKAIEYLEIYQEFYGLKTTIKEIKEVFSSLGLKEEMLYKKISKFSKGMKQKLGLCLGFLSQREIIIFDEPMTGLDPISRYELKKQIKSYVKQKEKTIIFSSHILSDIEELCENILLIDNGEIKFLGKTSDFTSSNNKTCVEKAFIKTIKS